VAQPEITIDPSRSGGAASGGSSEVMIDGFALSVPPPGKNLPPRAFTSREVFEIEQRAKEMFSQG